MRIGIDAHVMGRARGGAETYMTNLLAELRAIGAADHFTVFVSPEGADVAKDLWAANFTYEVVDAQNLAYQRFVVLPKYAARAGLDVLHVQRVVPLLMRAARVVTIHDVAHTARSDLFNSAEGFALRRLTAMSARRAEHVITDSEASRRDIIETFSVHPERVSAIPLGVNHWDAHRRVVSRAELGERHSVRVPYVLCVSAIEKRKNLALLIDAYSRLVAEFDSAPQLVIAGGVRTAGLDATLAAQCQSLNVERHVVLTGYVDAETLSALYANAHAFVFPSVLEGFGLPPLEALAHGLPVAASDIPVHREMLADDATYFDPCSAEALMVALRSVVSDETLRRRLAGAGPLRAARFTWRKTAERTLAVYHDAAARWRAHSGAVG